MPVVKPGPKGKIDSRLSLSRGKQDGRYPVVTKELDLPIRLLVMRDGRPPPQHIRNQIDKALSKVRESFTTDLGRAVHVWVGKVIALYKYNTLKEMKAFVGAASKSGLFSNLNPGLDEKQAIFTAFWDNYNPKNAEKIFLWAARFIHFNEPLSRDGIIPPGSFWVKTFFVNLAVKTKLHLDAPNDSDNTWPDLQAFFDTFPRRHPVHHKVHISDFKIREDPKTMRHTQYFFAPPSPGDDSAVGVLSASAKTTAAAVDNAIAAPTSITSTTRVIRKPVSVAQQKRVHKQEMMSLRRRSVREMSSLSSEESEGEVCVPPKRKPLIERSSYQQRRINKIEKGSSFDKMTITDYVLQSDTVQTMLLFGNS